MRESNGGIQELLRCIWEPVACNTRRGKTGNATETSATKLGDGHEGVCGSKVEVVSAAEKRRRIYRRRHFNTLMKCFPAIGESGSDSACQTGGYYLIGVVHPEKGRFQTHGRVWTRAESSFVVPAQFRIEIDAAA